MRPIFRLLPLPLAIAVCLPVLAADDKPLNWGLCPVQESIPAFEPSQPTTGDKTNEDRSEQTTMIEGGTLVGSETKPQYSDNVILRRGKQYLNADGLTYDMEKETYVADGNVRYQDGSMRIIAARARGEQANDTHTIEDLKYQLVSRRGNGSATSIDLKGNVGQLHDSTYSTCDPAQRVWELRSRRIDVNTTTGWGVAHGAAVRIGKVPVLYIPWLKFPIDDQRHTGLLYPAISQSSRNGFDLKQPIYLNLAPNFDATLSPRYMSQRGSSLGAQFRYLYARGRGQLDSNWMPHDDLIQEQIDEGDYLTSSYQPDPDASRGSFRFGGFHNLNARWQARTNLAWISDPRYLEDFSNSLGGIAASTLGSSIGVYGLGQHWSAGIMADAWRLADFRYSKDILPYNRLPRLYFNWEQPFGQWLTAGVDSELVRFQHDSIGSGNRLDLKPYVSMPLQGASWFITPTLAWRYTGYQLDDRLSAALGSDQSPSRSLPIASLDAGLFFERNMQLGDKPYLQTIEPRLYYLNAPYRDQSNLPIFDTRDFTFGWGQLFRDNRFSGPDRQTDANQLTVALTSRVIRQTDGHEKFSANLGQIFYFDDSLVTMPNELPIQKGKSAWVADANYSPTDRWTLGASYQWDSRTGRQDLASLRARYLLSDDGVVNLGYRYRRDQLEQVDFSFLYPITPTWSVVGRYYHSLQDHKLLEAIAGVQWDSCCLAVRLLTRRYVRNHEGELNNSIQVEFVLKGLGSAGQDTERTLRRAILGYDRNDLYLVPPSNTTPNPDDNDSGPDPIL